LVLARLADSSAFSARELNILQGQIVTSDYFGLPEHCGHVDNSKGILRRSDGTEHTFHQVPIVKVVQDIETHINDKKPFDRRTRTYHDILAGIPGHKATPGWDLEPPHPNANPVTPFSVTFFSPQSLTLS